MTYDLEQHFPGEQAWSDFVKATTSDDHSELKDDLVRKLKGHTDIASVIWFLIGNTSASWISQPIPALNGLTPLECLATPLLLLRLKSMLMRMPC